LIIDGQLLIKIAWHPLKMRYSEIGLFWGLLDGYSMTKGILFLGNIPFIIKDL
jgi:hypothetical protein